MFDEEPDDDPHGECGAEIRRLNAEVDRLNAILNNAFALSVCLYDRGTASMSSSGRVECDTRLLRAGTSAIPGIGE